VSATLATGACGGSVTACAGRGPAGDDDAAGCVAVGAVQAASALSLMPGATHTAADATTASVASSVVSSSSALYLAGPVSSAHAWLPIGRGVAVGGRVVCSFE
jgi:hypothetical protein